MCEISSRYRKLSGKAEPWLNQWRVESGSGEGLGANRSGGMPKHSQQEDEGHERGKTKKATLIRAPRGPAGKSPDVWEVGGHDEEEQGVWK